MVTFTNPESPEHAITTETRIDSGAFSSVLPQALADKLAIHGAGENFFNTDAGVVGYRTGVVLAELPMAAVGGSHMHAASAVTKVGKGISLPVHVAITSNDGANAAISHMRAKPILGRRDIFNHNDVMISLERKSVTFTPRS